MKGKDFNALVRDRDQGDTLRQMAAAKTANSAVVAKPAPLDECKRLGIELTWFVPQEKTAKSNAPLVNINSVRVIINKRCRELMGDMPLKADIAKQGKGYIVLRFSEQGATSVTTTLNNYLIKRKGLIPWLEAQGVALGSYPIEWDAATKCLYLRLSGHMPLKSKKEESHAQDT